MTKTKIVHLTIDKRGLEGLETPNIFICTHVVIGAFLYGDFLVRFRSDTWSKLLITIHHWYDCVACVLTIIMSCVSGAKL